MFSGASNRSFVSHVFTLKEKKFLHQWAKKDFQSCRGTGVAADFTAHKRFVNVANDGCPFGMNLATVWSDLKPHRWFCVYWNKRTWTIFLLLCPFVALVCLFKGRHMKLWQSEVTMLRVRHKSRRSLSAVCLCFCTCLGDSMCLCFPGVCQVK